MSSLKNAAKLICAGMMSFTGLAVCAEDPYILSDGLSGINTGYHMKGGISRVELDYQLPDADKAGQYRLIGFPADEKTLGMLLYFTAAVGSTPGSLRSYVWQTPDASSSYIVDGSISYVDTNRHKVSIDLKNGMLSFISGATTNSTRRFARQSNTSCVADLPISICGQYSSATATDFVRSDVGTFGATPAVARIYGVKFYENDVLVHNYVPCLRDDGVACMKDLVDGGFIVGENASAFTIGGDYETYPDAGWVSTVANASGGQLYFDTDYPTTPDTAVELDCALEYVPSGSGWYQYILDGSLNSGERFFAVLCNDQYSNLRYAMKSTRYNPLGYPAPTASQDFRKNRRTYILDGYNKICGMATCGYTNLSETTTAKANLDASTTLKIASAYTGGYFASIKIYGCKIYEEGVLARDFVPRVRKGVPGLYDKITGAFIVAKNSGSGVLAYGGEIWDDDPYIESNGTSGINTGYHMKSGVSRLELDYRLTDASTSGQGRLVSSTHDVNVFNIVYFMGDTGQTSSGMWIYVTQKPSMETKIVSFQPGCVDNEGHTVTVDLKNSSLSISKCGSVVTQNFSAPSTAGYTASMPISLCGQFSSAEATTFDDSRSIKARIYGCRMYENEVLVRNFVPGRRYDGTAGLMDLVTGEFVTGLDPNAFTAGGKGLFEEDACLVSDGTTGMSTGYKMKNNISRVEMDFALAAEESAQYRILGDIGCEDSIKLQFNITGTHGTPGVYWRCSNGSQAVYWSPVDMRRHTVYADLASKKCYISGHTEQNITGTFGDEARLPIPVFGPYADANGTTFANNNSLGYCPKMKVYSVRFYENYKIGGVNKPVRELIPYAKDGVVGFYDTVSGEIVRNENAAAGAFTLYGQKVDGEFRVYVSPNVSRIKNGETATLKAYAPGAESYRWFRNGVEVAGVTGDTLEASWSKQSETVEDNCYIDTFTVKAVYRDANGETFDSSESSASTVRSVKPGTMIIIM